jgi:hypothetical protein
MTGSTKSLPLCALFTMIKQADARFSADDLEKQLI